MPFTPYHMGPAFPVKGASGSGFSLLLYGYTQVLLDLEALYRIWRHDPELHGYSHTFLGATLIGIVALITGKPLFEFWLRIWNRISRSCGFDDLLVDDKIRWQTAIFTVFIGSWLHVLLDAIMHQDVRPFAPFSDANPLLRLIGVRELHQFCVLTALVGLVWIGMVWLIRTKRTAE